MKTGHTSAVPRIVVVGSINMDLVVRSPRLPRPGETLMGRSFREIAGGKGANQAVAAARLGASVKMIGCLGDDVYESRLRQGLQQNGVDTQFVAAIPDCSSGLAVIGVDDSGQNSIIVVPGANGQLDAGHLRSAEAAFAEADILLLQLEVPLSTVFAALQLARKHQLITILDPAPAQAGILPTVMPLDVICPNEGEAEMLTGLDIRSDADAAQAVRRLCDLGARYAVITLGDRGVIWCCDQLVQRQAAFAVQAVDSTAAGDAFAAALGLRMAEGAEFGDAVRFACAAGAVATSREGAQPAMPSRVDVDACMLNAVHGEA